MTSLERTVSQLLSLYWMDRMSKFEASLFDLPDPPKRNARPKHSRLNDVALPGAPRVGLVDADGHVGGFRGGDQGVGLIPVHEHQSETQALQPVAQEVGNPPCDAPAIAPVGSLQLGYIAVGEAEPVVEFLLGDAESFPTATQHPDEFVFVADDHRFDGHFEPHNHETPHG